jgi:hypothetical protein
MKVQRDFLLLIPPHSPLNQNIPRTTSTMDTSIVDALQAAHDNGKRSLDRGCSKKTHFNVSHGRRQEDERDQHPIRRPAHATGPRRIKTCRCPPSKGSNAATISEYLAEDSWVGQAVGTHDSTGIQLTGLTRFKGE